MKASDVLSGSRRWSIEQGDCIEWMRSLPSDSVDLVFTSPPYEMARHYLEGGKNLGIARKTEDWVRWLIEVIRECSRVCKGLIAFVVEGQTRQYRYSAGPLLLAADLHRAGFNLRKPAVYRRIGIPGSGGPDWLRNDWEPIICVTRNGRLPWSCNTACGHAPKWAPGGEMSHRSTDGTKVNQWGMTKGGTTNKKRDGSIQPSGRPSHKFGTATRGHANGDAVTGEYDPPAIANPGNVIDCNVGGGAMGSNLAHDNEAPFPLDLAAFFVKSFCPPSGITLDCFSGSGTTAHASIENDRRFIGCDLRQSQVDLTTKRLMGVTPALPGMVR